MPRPVQIELRGQAERVDRARGWIERAAEGRVEIVGDGGAVAILVDRGAQPAGGAWPRLEVVLDVDAEDAERLAARVVRYALELVPLDQGREGSFRPLEAFFDLADRGLLFISNTGTVLEVNRALCQWLGRQRSEVLGSSVDEWLANGELDHAPRRLRSRSRGRLRVLTGIRRYRHRDGHPVALHLSATPVYDPAGHTRYLFAQLTPATPAERGTWRGIDAPAVAQALRRVDGLAAKGSHPRRVFNEALRFFQTLLGARDAFLAQCERPAGGELRLRLQAMQSAEGYLGYDEVGLSDGLAPGDSETLASRAIRSGHPLFSAAEVELWGREHGAARAAQALALPLRRNGEVLGLVVLTHTAEAVDGQQLELLRPLTSVLTGIVAAQVERDRRTAAQEELVESRRTVETLLANLPGMVYRCDDDEIRTLLFASAGSKSLIGLEPAELIGRAAGALLPLTARADRQLVQEEVRWSLLQRRRFELTYRLERPDGVEIWVREQGQGVFNTEGELLFVEGFLTDVTSRRRADEERRRLETRVRRAHKVESLAVLAGGIAHDFNNLLVSVLGNAQFVRDRVTQEDEEARSALRSIESAAERAASLTQYMLAYTGREQISPARLSPTGLVQSSLPMLERSVPSNVVLRATLEADVPPILGDGGQLQRALVEVVRNSGEALGTREGHIELRVQAQEFGTRELAEAWLGARLAPGRYAVIAIADDGPGMDETVRQRAFDPFFTTRGAGRGLGLAAVLGAVRAHGGAMQLESAPGAGTTLRMILPLAQEPEVVLDPAPRVALPTPPQGPLVLVVDDEPLVREVARRALQRAGYRVLCAVDGSDALTQFRAQPQAIDAVLLDLTMPQMTGEETLARLRAERTDLPVLLSSGFAERDVLARLHAHHPVHFLRKPYRLAELVEKMSAALAGPARVP